MKISKIMGLDLGSVTCGVSLSDGLKMFAHPYETLRFEDEAHDTLKAPLEAIINKENVEKIILGYPKMMNNDVGPRAQISEAFKEKLESSTEESTNITNPLPSIYKPESPQVHLTGFV